MTAYSASASYGASPAYIDWKLKMRCSRSSPKNDATLRPSLPNAAEPHQLEAGAPRPHQVERRVEVGVDEVRHLDAVQPLEPVAEPAERLRPRRPGEPADLLGHRLATVADEQRRPVGEARPVHRVDRLDGDEVGHVGAGGGEHVGQQSGHRQHGRTVVEPEPGSAIIPARPPGTRVALDDGDVVTGLDEVGGGGQPTETGADRRRPASARPTGHTWRQLT